ncbi:MAG TPA: radical SAM protein [Candidatus Hydrogenedens sp.]|nr:radical SAM protein [Candidatus Hydrogenedens sp.]
MYTTEKKGTSYFELKMNLITPLYTGIKILNVLYSRWRGIIPSYLPILIAFVTYRCNLRCIMCGLCELREHTNPDELTTEEWKSVIQSAKKLGTFIISISGGEPLLRKDLEEIICFAEGNKISTHLCTNGTLIDKDRAKTLRESGLKTISFSLDSAIEEVHDAIRGKGQYQKTITGIQNIRCIAPEIRISINTVITKTNFRNISSLVPLAKKLGAVQIKFAPIHSNLLHRFKNEKAWEELFFNEKELQELDNELTKAKNLCKIERILTTSDRFYSGISRSFLEQNIFTCFAGFLDCTVAPDGKVGACCDIETPLSVREQALDKIWKSAAFHPARQKVCQCKKYCWDTTNTEFSLRLNPKTMVSELPTMLKEVLFYLK